MSEQSLLSAPISSDNEQPWLQLPKENNLWYSRFSQYLALGPTRSIREVCRLEKRNGGATSPGAPWFKAAQRFDWQGRAQAYDAYQRQLVMTHGNALDTERVKKLDELIDKLYTRAMAVLETAPSDVQFSEKLVVSLLNAMDIMARHTGGYAPRRVEHTGKDGKAIEVQEQQMHVIFYVPEAESDSDHQVVIAEQSEDEVHPDQPAS
jgi:hypothetical protein